MTSLLNLVETDNAQGAVKALYEQISQAFGRIPNAMKLHSLSPELMERQFGYIGYFMEHSGRSPKFHTLMRLLVSEDKGCEYCISLNTGMLLSDGMTMEEVEAIKKDPSQVPLEADERALLVYVLKATHAPASTSKEDVTRLRELGFSDKDIFEAVHYGANMVMVDILFETFQLENDEM